MCRRATVSLTGVETDLRLSPLSSLLREFTSPLLAFRSSANLSSLGAIFSSAAADFGVDGVIERLEQIKPHVLLVSNGCVYNAKSHALLPLLPKLLGSLTHPPKTTVLINHLPDELNPQANIADFIDGGNDGWTNLVRWDDWIGQYKPQEIKFERIGFNEPIWILFSSGTTGKPKAIVVSLASCN